MAEYIEREALYDALNTQGQTTLNVGDVLDFMAAMPAADVTPVVHAHWIKDADWEVIACSNCGDESDCTEIGEDEFRKIYRFCPHCGARMDKEADNG